MSIRKSQWSLVMEEVTIPPLSSTFETTAGACVQFGAPEYRKSGHGDTGACPGGTRRGQGHWVSAYQEGTRLFVEMGGGDRTRGNSSSCNMGSCNTWIFIIHFKAMRAITHWNRAL